MAHGIEVYNADGTLQFDVTDRLFRMLAITASGTVDGSVVVSGVDQGSVQGAIINAPNETGVQPTVTPTATGVSWTFNGAPSGERRDVSIAILVY